MKIREIAGQIAQGIAAMVLLSKSAEANIYTTENNEGTSSVSTNNKGIYSSFNISEMYAAFAASKINGSLSIEELSAHNKLAANGEKIKFNGVTFANAKENKENVHVLDDNGKETELTITTVTAEFKDENGAHGTIMQTTVGNSTFVISEVTASNGTVTVSETKTIDGRDYVLTVTQSSKEHDAKKTKDMLARAAQRKKGAPKRSELTHDVTARNELIPKPNDPDWMQARYKAANNAIAKLQEAQQKHKAYNKQNTTDERNLAQGLSPLILPYSMAFTPEAQTRLAGLYGTNVQNAMAMFASNGIQRLNAMFKAQGLDFIKINLESLSQTTPQTDPISAQGTAVRLNSQLNRVGMFTVVMGANENTMPGIAGMAPSSGAQPYLWNGAINNLGQTASSIVTDGSVNVIASYCIERTIVELIHEFSHAILESGHEARVQGIDDSITDCACADIHDPTGYYSVEGPNGWVWSSGLFDDPHANNLGHALATLYQTYYILQQEAILNGAATPAPTPIRIKPTFAPTSKTPAPSSKTTTAPTFKTAAPSSKTTKAPTSKTTAPIATSQPSHLPTHEPTTQPSHQPTTQATQMLTVAPTTIPVMTASPTGRPIIIPIGSSTKPTFRPTRLPTHNPTQTPTGTAKTTRAPTGAKKTGAPTAYAPSSTSQPSVQPTVQSTQSTQSPTQAPSQEEGTGFTTAQAAGAATAAVIALGLILAAIAMRNGAVGGKNSKTEIVAANEKIQADFDKLKESLEHEPEAIYNIIMQHYNNLICQVEKKDIEGQFIEFVKSEEMQKIFKKASKETKERLLELFDEEKSFEFSSQVKSIINQNKKSFKS